MLVTKHHQPLATSHRLGITLIEVMMSTMVVSLGILGLASLIPLGTHLTNRGTLADRVAILGERALHEFMIRGGHNPSRWFIPGDTDPATPGPNEFSLSTARLPVRQPYMIDPMFFGGNYGTDVSRTKFPYPTQLAIGGTDTFYDTTSKAMQMWRISLNTTPGGTTALSLPQAKLGFQSEDDLAIERPSDGELPAFQTFFKRTGASTTGEFVKRQATGEYSWMVMLVPEAYDQSRVSYLPSSNKDLTSAELQLMQPPINIEDFSGAGRASMLGSTINDVATDEYTAHVLITHKRAGGIPQGAIPATINSSSSDELKTNERAVEVASFLSSGGYSTGEVQLQCKTNDREDAEERVLKLSNGDWICLAGRLPRTSGTTYPRGDNFPRGDVYQWYRVVMVDDVLDSTGSSTGTSGPTYTRQVSISGPDWPSGAYTPTHAIIVEGVVGVYSKRIRLESQSPWSP
ncbi:hypothetical protein [Blastopirellula marina]|uniref:Uncharacterized protein n=1 Tax=Blastopirellula marina TaxID=124 RepID=A0A2S8G135_9BACT|nr:hypothetical protein [Blastopirellula marina]PQO38165.1 hypothetical protein C5Y98_08810 [Blastopirellula marina]PTL44821.1 hypothetical protein C5Y97_08815 [Blastopirellula marina]